MCRYSIEELEGFFRGAGLPMELHDRDRLPHDQTLDVIYSGVDEEFADFNAAVGVRSQRHSNFGLFCLTHYAVGYFVSGRCGTESTNTIVRPLRCGDGTTHGFACWGTRRFARVSSLAVRPS